MLVPTVSVVVTCYNLGHYLDEAIDSVLSQTFQDFDILIVDDGSTDLATRELLASYARPKTRVVHSANNGLSAARNLGIARSTAPYVCALDADDRLEPTMLEKSVATLDADPSIAFVSHWFRTFGDETWEWKPTRCDFPALLHENTVNGAALVRRTALEAVGGFDESFRDGCEDWDLWITMVERGFRGWILPEILFEYRRRQESMSRAMMRGERFPELYERLVEKHADTFRAHASALIVRREEELSDLRRHVDHLGREYHDWLEPALMKQRDDVRVLERRKERARLAIEQARELEAVARQAMSEVVALRNSLSWRITAPLRAAYEVVMKVAGTQRR